MQITNADVAWRWTNTGGENTTRTEGPLMNPLRSLNQHGQSVWLDNISRGLITGGSLQKLIDEDGVSGVTSNPTIFDKAIAGSTDYDAALHRALETGRNLDGRALAERLIV